MIMSSSMVSTTFVRFVLVAACVLSFIILGHPRLVQSSASSIASHLSKPVDRPSRPLVVYVYHETENARANLNFFIENGLHDHADFLFVFNGESDMIDQIPQHPYIATVQRDNTCFDLGAVGEVLLKNDLWKKYKRFITMNASVRGPFMPVWSRSCWTDLFLKRVTDRVKLVGTTVNCRHMPHVQSMVWATDDIGMGILLDDKLATNASKDDAFGSKDDPVGLSGCYPDWRKAVHAEIGSTALIRSQGYEVDALMTSFESKKDIDVYCEANNDFGDDVQFEKGYFGTNLHPYETLFIKTNRNVDPILIERLTTWQKERGFGSWESCKAAHLEDLIGSAPDLSWTEIKRPEGNQFGMHIAPHNRWGFAPPVSVTDVVGSKMASETALGQSWARTDIQGLCRRSVAVSGAVPSNVAPGSSAARPGDDLRPPPTPLSRESFVLPAISLTLSSHASVHTTRALSGIDSVQQRLQDQVCDMSGWGDPEQGRAGTRALSEPAGLEVVVMSHENYPYAYDPHSDAMPQKHPHELPGVDYPRGLPKYDEQDESRHWQQQPETPPRRFTILPQTGRQRVIWAVVGLLIVLAIIGGAIGGTVGRNNASSTGSADASAGTSSTSTAPSMPAASGPAQLKSIKPNSPLGVTAWRKVTGVELYLYYQGPDNVIRVSQYDSGRGLPTQNGSYWLQPATAAASAVPSTPIGATTILFSSDFQPQIEVFYFSPPDNLLSGVNFNNQNKPPVQADGVVDFNLTSHPDSSIATYWPYIIYQDIKNNIIEMRNMLDGYGAGFFGPSTRYFATNQNVVGMQGSDLGIVPLSAAFETVGQPGGYGVVYQRGDGSLSTFIPNAATTTNVTRSWPSNIAFPDIVIPKGNAIEAFATARPNDSKKRTNTFILYQATDGAINMVWQDDDMGWKTSRPVVLSKADNGTRIGCITMPMSHINMDGRPLVLEQASGETRCYFQRDVTVVEVRLNGTDWVELGIVPIP